MFSNVEVQHPAVQISVDIEQVLNLNNGNIQGILIMHSIIMFWYFTYFFSRKEIISIHVLLYLCMHYIGISQNSLSERIAKSSKFILMHTCL